MRSKRLVLVATLTAVGCSSAPTLLDIPVDQAVYLQGNPYRLLGTEELPVVGLAVDSEAVGFGKQRLDDGDLTSAWVNGATATLPAGPC